MTGPEERAKIINLIESKIEVISSLSIECVEQVYKAAWNEAIEAAELELHNRLLYPTEACAIIRKLKK